jgi:hypothetical protein
MTYPTFNNGDVLPASDLNAIGLWLIKSQAITGTPSTVVVSNVFGAEYDAYKVIVTGVRNTSTQADIQLQLNNASTGYYGSFQYVNYASNAFGVASNTNASQWSWVGSAANPAGWLGGLVCDIVNPFIVGFTSITASPVIYSQLNGSYTGIQDANLSHTGFNLIAGGGALSGGTIRVYGYRK